jgi:hypothetical protein
MGESVCFLDVLNPLPPMFFLANFVSQLFVEIFCFADACGLHQLRFATACHVCFAKKSPINRVFLQSLFIHTAHNHGHTETFDTYGRCAYRPI